MAASAYLDQVQQLYIAYFGRPADPVGQRYWAQVIDDAGGSISSVLAGFSASNESQALYGASSTAQKVAAIYSNVFNRAPEAAGLAYWIDQIDSGKVTQAQAAWTIQQAAGPGDASTVNNKLIAANVFTADIDTAAEVAGYSGNDSAAVARAFLNKVDATYASIADVATYAVTDVAQATGTGTVVVPPPVVVPVPLFSASVTAGVVNFNGAATGDITVSWSGAVGNSDATFSRGGIAASPITFGGAGASSIALAASDTLAGGIDTLQGLTTTGAGSVKLSDTPMNLAGSVIHANSAHDVLTVTGAASASIDLRSLNGFETINLAGNSGSGFLIADTPGAVINSSAVAIVTLGSGGQTFNGNSSTDDVAVNAGTNTLTGGGGNDYYMLHGGTNTITDLSTGDTVELAAGTVIANNVSALVADVSTYNLAHTNTAFTLNSATSGSTIDMSLTSAAGTAGFTIVGGSGVDIITGSSKADVLTGGAGTNTLTGGAGNDTFNISADSTNTITDLSTGDILTVAATGAVTANNVSAFVAIAATVNNASSNSAVTLNASAAGSTIDLHLATGTTGFTVVGGAGANTIVGSAKADIISGGASADTLTGGAGVDVFTFGASNRSTLANMDTITDFRATTGVNAGAADVITFSDIAPAVGSLGSVGQVNSSILSSALDTIASLNTVNNGLTVFTLNNDNDTAYVYIESTGSNSTYVATDTVIKLSGVSLYGSGIAGLGIGGV